MALLPKNNYKGRILPIEGPWPGSGHAKNMGGGTPLSDEILSDWLNAAWGSGDLEEFTERVLYESELLGREDDE